MALGQSSCIGHPINCCTTTSDHTYSVTLGSTLCSSYALSPGYSLTRSNLARWYLG